MSKFDEAFKLLEDGKQINNETIANERNIVARIMADKTKSQEYYALEFMQSQTWWTSQKLYHLFMFLLYLNHEGDAPGFWGRMAELGKIILEAEKLEKKAIK